MPTPLFHPAVNHSRTRIRWKLLNGKQSSGHGGRYDRPSEADEEEAVNDAAAAGAEAVSQYGKATVVKRMDGTVEPVFFHCLPYMLWGNLVPSMDWLAVIDLAECAYGSLALACVKQGAP